MDCCASINHDILLANLGKSISEGENYSVAKQKRSYSVPHLILLRDTQKAWAECSQGSGDSELCDTGVTANAGCYGNGNNASLDCSSDGVTAIQQCGESGVSGTP
jgi:hypothetical protein